MKKIFLVLIVITLTFSNLVSISPAYSFEVNIIELIGKEKYNIVLDVPMENFKFQKIIFGFLDDKTGEAICHSFEYNSEYRINNLKKYTVYIIKIGFFDKDLKLIKKSLYYLYFDGRTIKKEAMNLFYKPKNDTEESSIKKVLI
jgi:hypothetical protein